MKNLLILITIMLVGGCTPTPEQKVVGRYVGAFPFHPKDIVTFDLLKNGIAVHSENGKKDDSNHEWALVKGEVHVNLDGIIQIFRINKEEGLDREMNVRSITLIAMIEDDGNRTDLPEAATIAGGLLSATFKKH